MRLFNWVDLKCLDTRDLVDCPTQLYCTWIFHDKAKRTQQGDLLQEIPTKYANAWNRSFIPRSSWSSSSAWLGLPLSSLSSFLLFSRSVEIISNFEATWRTQDFKANPYKIPEHSETSRHCEVIVAQADTDPEKSVWNSFLIVSHGHVCQNHHPSWIRVRNNAQVRKTIIQHG